MALASFFGGGCSRQGEGTSTSTRPPAEAPVEGAKGDGKDGRGAPDAAPDPDGGETDGRNRIDPLRGASMRPAGGEATGSSVALLTRVQVGRHHGFDRVVFEFRGDLPGYRVEYTAPPVREDGSGRRVRVAGEALVRIRMEPASAYDLEAGTPTFRPGRLLGARAGTSVVREVVRAGDFEAVLTWVVGLRKRVAFRVRTLRAPARLVIDFRNR
jgi:hypothetical protein